MYYFLQNKFNNLKLLINIFGDIRTSLIMIFDWLVQGQKNIGGREAKSFGLGKEIGI